MFPEIYILVSTAVLLFCVYNTRKKARYTQFAQKIGGPKGYPIVGNALDFLRNSDRTLLTLLKWVDEFGDRFVFTFGPYMVFLTNDMKDLETVLTSSILIDKSEDYDQVKDWLGDGLITSTGQHWQYRRKLITPTFHFSILERFFGPINTQANILVDILHKNFSSSASGQSEYKDVCPLVSRCTLDTICETAMGIQLNAQRQGGNDYVDAVHRMGELFQYRSIRPWLRSRFAWKLTAKGREETKCLQTIHSFTDDVVAQRKLRMLSGDIAPGLENEGKIRLALLDLLLESQKNGSDISDAGLREEATTFIFAGHDTTSVAVSFCLFNLGNHPDVQDKLHHELDEIFQGDHTRPITSADVKEMKYLDCCIKESLRLFPSVPAIARNAKHDFQLDENTVIPAGVAVYLFPFKLHRNPKYFPKPNEFIPERFATGSSIGNKNPFAYIPFSAGQRNCIGQKLAMLMMKILLATILRRFKVKAEQKIEELELLSEIVLRTKEGIKLRFQER